MINREILLFKKIALGDWGRVVSAALGSFGRVTKEGLAPPPGRSDHRPGALLLQAPLPPGLLTKPASEGIYGSSHLLSSWPREAGDSLTPTGLQGPLTEGGHGHVAQATALCLYRSRCWGGTCWAGTCWVQKGSHPGALRLPLEMAFLSLVSMFGSQREHNAEPCSSHAHSC